MRFRISPVRLSSGVTRSGVTCSSVRIPSGDVSCHADPVPFRTFSILHRMNRRISSMLTPGEGVCSGSGAAVGSLPGSGAGTAAGIEAGTVVVRFPGHTSGS